MDLFSDYHALLTTAYTTVSPLLLPLLRLLAPLQAHARAVLLPLLTPLLALLARTTSDAPAIVSLAALLLAVFVAVRLLGLFRRLLAFGARLVFALLFYGALLLAAACVWQRGVERTVGDLAAWTAEVRHVWVREYGRWNEVQRAAQREAAARHGWR